MLIALHKNARTTPAVRAEIAASHETASVLAQRFGITEQTVYKWKKREVFGDRSHTAHHLQTVLTPAQETVVVHLRRTLLLPLDDLLAVTREFICAHVSRSGLDRCLRRHGAGNLNDLKPREPAVVHKAFKSYEPGYVHVDVKYLPQMQDESSRRYLFVAIDRATRWVFVQFKTHKTAASAKAFLNALHKACPIRIKKLLTDNGKEFTDRLFAGKEREPSGQHEFDQLCQELGIEHRLTKPRTPRTNGMVERFNGRIADVLKTHRFNSREDMQQAVHEVAGAPLDKMSWSSTRSRRTAGAKPVCSARTLPSLNSVGVARRPESLNNVPRITAMPHAYAFFDVDGTLLNMKSMFSFHDYWYRRWLPAHSAAAGDEFEDVTAILRALTENGSPRELVNRRYYEFFAGRSVEAVAACAKAWTRNVLADPPVHP